MTTVGARPSQAAREPSGMKRGIAALLLLIALGAASTVLLAWIAAAVPVITFRGVVTPRWDGSRRSDWTRSGWIRAQVAQGWGSAQWSLKAAVPETWRSDRVRLQTAPSWSVAAEPTASVLIEVAEEAAGWPWWTLTARTRGPSRVSASAGAFGAPERQHQRLTAEGGIRIAQRRLAILAPATASQPSPRFISLDTIEGDGVLPWTPIPWRFAASAGLHALVWGAIIFGFGIWRATRAWIRRRRERCPHCGQVVRGRTDQRCSECGLASAVSSAHTRLVTRSNLAASVLVLIALCVSLGAIARSVVARHAIDPIEAAVKRGRIAEVVELCRNDSAARRCAAVLAAHHGRVDLLEAMKREPHLGFSPDRLDGEQALDAAILAQQPRVVEWIIEHQEPRVGRSALDPMMIAAECGDLRSMKLLAVRDPEWISALIDRSKPGSSSSIGPQALFKIASFAADPAMFRWLLAELDQRLEALSVPNADRLIRQLLERDACLEWALFYRRESQVREILSRGVDPCGQHGAALAAAIQSRDPAMVNLLFGAGVPANPTQLNPLRVAMECDDIDMARLLVSRGTKVEHEAGALPGWLLQDAIENGCGMEWVLLLVDAGADPAAACGGLPIETCLQLEEVPMEILEYLDGLHPFWANDAGHGAPELVNAVLRGREELVRRMLSLGASTREPVDGKSVSSLMNNVLNGTAPRVIGVDPESVRRAARLVSEAEAQRQRRATSRP